MNFSTTEFMLGRQRGRQWVPLISQQFRLRHVYQIMGFNLLSETAGSYYFTLHLTTMCAPFYTSQHINSPNPKWPELDLRETANTSASCIVLRIWQHCSDGADKIILTWGVHFSGLVYLGNKIVEIQPIYFKNNSVIFFMQGGYYTSHHAIKTDLQKPIPFLNNVNLINTVNNKAIYRRVAIKVPHCEIQDSYNLDKLRRLHSIQIEIKKKSIEVQNIRDKINMQNCSDYGEDHENSKKEIVSSSSTCNIRYAPQLLTMNSLNKMLQEKPTRIQKQEMLKISKEIETQKSRIRLLSQEKDRKSVCIRQLKQKYLKIVEENEEKNFNLMESYHVLSREGERLKEYKRSVVQHREVYSVIHLQLQQRRRRLLQELLFIYPIEKHSENKYTVHGIYLPKSDVLADCSDIGLSVALGYITHILIMCSTFLQVPLRYPLTHYGSRSYISDNVSPLLPDKERDFPLFTRGKDKTHFTYAVYLLNKNLAQLRWLYYLNTNDLKSTLANLLNFLQGPKELRIELGTPKNDSSGSQHIQSADVKLTMSISPSHLAVGEKYVSLHSFGSNSNISDPILDCIRHDKQIQRASSSTRKPIRKPVSKPCRNSECGRGLSEILAIPEAFLNKQISSDSFRNYIVSGSASSKDGSCCDICQHELEGYWCIWSEYCTNSFVKEGTFNANNSISAIKITNGKEVDMTFNISSDNKQLIYQDLIEQGTDPLDPMENLSTIITKSIEIHSDNELHTKIITDISITQNKRISRSAGSYTDDEPSLVLRTNFELGSEPGLNISHDLTENNDHDKSNEQYLSEGQQDFLQKWLKTTPNLCSDENLYPDEYLGTSSGQVSHNSPLTARTDALLSTKSFNLVKPKP